MKPSASAVCKTAIMLCSVNYVASQICAEDPYAADYPNCTEANTAFCEEVGGTTIFRCRYPYGKACPGNCMDK